MQRIVIRAGLNGANPSHSLSEDSSKVFATGYAKIDHVAAKSPSEPTKNKNGLTTKLGITIDKANAIVMAAKNVF